MPTYASNSGRFDGPGARRAPSPSRPDPRAHRLRAAVGDGRRRRCTSWPSSPHWSFPTGTTFPDDDPGDGNPGITATPLERQRRGLAADRHRPRGGSAPGADSLYTSPRARSCRSAGELDLVHRPLGYGRRDPVRQSRGRLPRQGWLGLHDRRREHAGGLHRSEPDRLHARHGHVRSRGALEHRDMRGCAHGAALTGARRVVAGAGLAATAGAAAGMLVVGRGRIGLRGGVLRRRARDGRDDQSDRALLQPGGDRLQRANGHLPRRQPGPARPDLDPLAGLDGPARSPRRRGRERGDGAPVQRLRRTCARLHDEAREPRARRRGVRAVRGA